MNNYGTKQKKCQDLGLQEGEKNLSVDCFLFQNVILQVLGSKIPGGPKSEKALIAYILDPSSFFNFYLLPLIVISISTCISVQMISKLLSLIMSSVSYLQ